jgi:hypothetical protein
MMKMPTMRTACRRQSQTVAGQAAARASRGYA